MILGEKKKKRHKFSFVSKFLFKHCMLGSGFIIIIIIIINIIIIIIIIVLVVILLFFCFVWFSIFSIKRGLCILEE